MRETSIYAFLQLLSLIANVNKGKVSQKAEKLIRDILNRVIRTEKLNEYIEQFRELVIKNHKINISTASSIPDKKKRASQSVKALVICEKSNEILQQHEKIRIIGRLIEFANEDGVVTEQENELLEVVKQAFNIDSREYNDIKAFILDPALQKVRKDKLIIVESIDNPVIEGVKHLYWHGLNGRLVVLYIESCNIFLTRYVGDDLLYKNAWPMVPDSIEILDPNSFIRGSKMEPLYYSTLMSRFFQDQIKKDLEFVVKEAEYKFRNSDNGVKRFSLATQSGDLVGIMGGSGVGKSTLLNLLNGTLKPLRGHIYINGYDIHKHQKELEGLIGYVPQDDLLIEDLTVFQNLYYNAKLCFHGYSKTKILKEVVKVLKELDLYEVRNLKVGSPLEKFISGGQRKRLNIGLELIRSPSILFLDEPTSGLSSMDAESVMLLLKRQSNHGKIVIVNIHQPSSYIYKLFNKILVMDKGGVIAYQGGPLDALVYFKTSNELLNAGESQCETCGNVNPEQVLENVETKLVNEFGRNTGIRRYSPDYWYQRYLDNFDEGSKIKVRKFSPPKIQFSIPGRFKQFLIYTQRDIRAKLENTQYLLITFLEAPILALIIGYFTKFYSGTADNPDAYLFSQNANLVSYLFMSVVVSLFLGMILSAEEIIKDALILKRESFLNLSRWSYLNSKILIVFFISAIQMISYVVIGNTMLEIKGMTFFYWIILFSASCTANIIGLNISASLKTVASIYIVIPLILVPLILFSGTVVPFDRLRTLVKHSTNVPLVGDLMTSRWAFEALAVRQFKNNRYEKNFFDEEMVISQANYKTAFLFPRIKNILEEALRFDRNPDNNEKRMTDLVIIKNELRKLDEETGSGNLRKLWDFGEDDFSEQKKNRIESYLDSLTDIYLSNSRKARQEQDREFRQLERKLGSKEAFIDFRNQYHNKSVADLVLNRSSVYKILETRRGFIQLMDPVFNIPDSKIGMAHMYAPVKRIGNLYIDTFAFNLIIIWLTTFIAIVVLYFNILRRAMMAFEAFRIRRVSERVKKSMRHVGK